MPDSPDTIARLVDPAARADALKADLAEVWRELLGDPAQSARLAAILHTDAAGLASLHEPPVAVKKDGSGISGTDILIVVATWAASDIVLKAVAELGKDALKKALQDAWSQVVKPALQRRQRKPGALGD